MPTMSDTGDVCTNSERTLPFSERLTQLDCVTPSGNIHNLCLLEQIFQESWMTCCQVPDASASTLKPVQGSVPDRRHRTSTAVEGKAGKSDTIFRELFQCSMEALEALGTSENSIIANLVKKLLGGCHKKLNYQKLRKLHGKYTSSAAKIGSRGKEIVLAPVF